MRTRVIITHIVFLVICLGIASLSGWVTEAHVQTWYPHIHKPSFNPPPWIFGPVWTVLYIMIAFAGARIWQLRAAYPKVFYAFVLQLIFNFAWSFLFFGAQNILLGLIDIILLWVSLLTTIILVSSRDRYATWLLLPYFIWVSFAFILNISLYLLN